jgi:hypothetical protein
LTAVISWRRCRIGAGVLDELDDRAVLLGDPVHEVRALDQVGEALRAQHHVDDVGLIGLVELDQPGGERGARLRQAFAQAHEPGALGAQVGLDLQQLPAALVQGPLDGGLAGSQARDLGLEAVDPRAVGRDLRREHALGALLATDLALDLLDLVAERRGGRAGIARVGDQRGCTPHRERQRDARREGTEAHEEASILANFASGPSTGA